MRCQPSLALLLLASCGKPLGSYHIDRATLVPVSAIAPFAIEQRSVVRSDPRLSVRLDLSSTTDLIAVAEHPGAGLYLQADRCPFRHQYSLTAFGPYPDDAPLYGPADAEGHMPERHPVRGRDGRHHYTGYLIVADGASQFAEAYDLRRRPSDICLRIFNPGYHITASTSAIFRLEAATLRQVLIRRPRR